MQRECSQHLSESTRLRHQRREIETLIGKKKEEKTKKKGQKKEKGKGKTSSLTLQSLLLTNQKLVPKRFKLVSHLVVLGDRVVVDFAVPDHKPKVILKKERKKKRRERRERNEKEGERQKKEKRKRGEREEEDRRKRNGNTQSPALTNEPVPLPQIRLLKSILHL